MLVMALDSDVLHCLFPYGLLHSCDRIWQDRNLDKGVGVKSKMMGKKCLDFKLGSGLSVTAQMFVPFQIREEVSG